MVYKQKENSFQRSSGEDPHKQAIAYGGTLNRSEDSPIILADILQKAATTEQGIIYIRSDRTEEFQSYKDLFSEAQRIKQGLIKIGLQPQDRVIIKIESDRDFISAFWGCILGGFVPVPITHIASRPKFVNKTISKLCYTLQMLERPLLLTDASFAAKISNIPELLQIGKFPMQTVAELRKEEPTNNWYQSQPDDVAAIVLTSGSTGIPKGVLLSHRNLLSQAMGSVQMNGFTKEDITLNWTPLEHVAGLIYFHIRDIYLGSKQIHFSLESFLQEPLIWLDLIDRFKVNITFGPNYAYGLIDDCAEAIAQRKWDLSSMKFFLNGAETIVAKTARRFLQLLAPHGLSPNAMRPSWGMAESSSGVTFADRFSLSSTTDDDLFVEVGSPIPGVDLRVVDNRNQVVAEGDIGALQVKGLTVTSGYYQNQKANQQALTEDGWFKTEDLGLIKDGRLTITGREKDVIIIRAENYYSHEIEAAVEEIEGVEVSYTAACAVREPGDNTDRLAVFFSTTDTNDKFLNELMQKIPNKVVEKIGVSPDFLILVPKDMIPKTAIGKIQRQELRKRFETGGCDRIFMPQKKAG